MFINAPHKPIPPTISQRFQWLRLPLIIGVIVAHADPVGVPGLPEASGWAAYILRLLSDVWARNNVSLLFVMAGYLFFHSFSPTWESYSGKLRRRLHTLLIPYLFWNLANLLLLALLQALPFSGALLSGQQAPVAAYSWYEYLDAFTGINGMPAAYPFWFIRDLILMALLSPLFYLLAKKLPWLTAAALYAYWFLSPDTVVVLGPRSLLCFFLGAAWALRALDLSWVDRRRSWVLAAYLLLSLADAAWLPQSRWLHHLTMTLGAPALWALFGYVERLERLADFLVRWAAASFFVFAVHEPTLTVIKKLIFRLLPPESDLAILGLYFLAIILSAAAGMLAYRLGLRLVPRLTHLVSGGR